MNKKVVIAIVIIVVVIIIGVVGFLIYKSNKKKKDALAQQQMMILQQQLAQNPNMPPTQKAGILGQIANLAAMISASKQNGLPSGPLPGLGGGGYTPPVPVVDAGGYTPIEPAGFPLKNGSDTSKAPVGFKFVQNIQSAMNLKCGKKLIVDGKFGPLTQSAATQCIGYPTISWKQYQDYVTV